MTEYTTEDLLPLSGIQHFLFCRRRWALIAMPKSKIPSTLRFFRAILEGARRRGQRANFCLSGKLIHRRLNEAGGLALLLQNTLEALHRLR